MGSARRIGTTRRLLGAGAFALALAGAGLATPALGDDDVTIRIEFKDGVVTPARVEAPAKTRLRLDLNNLGDGPAEFESKSLRLEKVLAAHGHAIMVIRNLDPGEYDFFDDFHPDSAPAVIVAK